MDRLNRANLVRGLVNLAVGGFFVYRFLQIGGPLYATLVAVFLIAGLLGLVNRLPGRWQNIAFNLGISLFFLDLVFSGLEWAEFGEALATANYWWFIPSTLALLTHLYFRTLRAQWLLKPMGEVTFWPVFRALNIGIMFNTVLPARAGEFLRAYVLSRSTGLSSVGIFATVVVERIFDGLTVLLVLVGVVILGVRNPELQQAGILGAIFYVGAIVAVVVFMLNRRLADTIANKLLPHNLAEFVLKIFDGFVSGLQVLKNPRQLSMVIFWNIWTWVMIPISFWFALLAFDFGSPVPWTAPVLLLPAMALALTIPGAPGGVGLVQFAVKLALDSTFLDLPTAPNFAETVAAASIFLHLSQLAPEAFIGIISFMYEGLSTSDIKAGQEQMAGSEVVVEE